MSRIFQVLVVVGLAGIFVLAQNNTGTSQTTAPGATGQPSANPNDDSPQKQQTTQAKKKKKHKKARKGTASKSNSNSNETPTVNDSNMGSSHGTGDSQQDPESSGNTRTGDEPKQNPPQQAPPSNPPQPR